VKGVGRGSGVRQGTRGGSEVLVKRREEGRLEGGKECGTKRTMREMWERKEGWGGEEDRGGEEGAVPGWQKGTPFCGGPGPSRSNKALHRAKSCQHTGHRAYAATSEEEGGRGTTSWTWDNFPPHSPFPLLHFHQSVFSTILFSPLITPPPLAS